MGLEFRLLGPVEARFDGRLLDVGAARQRCVLAALLVDANRPVPADVLVERVWSSQVPRHSRTALSGYLSRLRRVAAPGGVQISRRSGGYVLAVDPAAVDLHRFHALVGRARAAASDEDAAADYAQALGLWQGEPLATLDTPWANGVRTALEEERRTAELDRNDVELRRGGHAALLADLSAQSAARPLDERLAGQLMVALYRCGRQGEALDRYREIRLRLAAELGADPGPPLQHLHEQLLRTDPALDLPAAPPPGHQPGDGRPHPPVPAQLPADVRGFVGRGDQLAGLDAVLAGSADEPAAVVISAVSGTAGVGKTALAVHWAHRVAGRFPDGQLYINLRGFDPDGQAMEPATAVRRFLDALGIPGQRVPADLDEQTALYRSTLAGKRVLVVLDNARTAEQVRPLLPGARGCLVVVTSRSQLPGLVAADGARPLSLDLLTPAEGRQLLAARLGTDRVAAEPGAVAEIVARCARLPLALAIVAGRGATHPTVPLRVLADELRDTGSRLATLRTAEDPHTDLRAVFSWSYQALAAGTARLFRLLGHHPGPDIAAPAAASLAAVPVAVVRPLLAELTRAGLLAEHVPGRYGCHDLLRAYATDLGHAVDSDADRRAGTGRTLDHYLHTAYGADRLLAPRRDAPVPPVAAPAPGTGPEHLADDRAAMAWLTAERAVLLSALRQAAAAGFDTHTWQLAWALDTFLDRQGHWHDLTVACQAALDAADRLGEPAVRGYAHRNLAWAHTRLGRHADADTHLRQALELFVRAGDRIGQATTHLVLAGIWERQDRPGSALEHTRQALDLFRAAGHRRGEANSLNSAGWDHALLGDYTQALAYCGQALALLEQLGDRYGEAHTWDSLGYAHQHLDHHTEAADCYRHAIDLYRDLGDRYYEADTLTQLGDTQLSAGDPDSARTAWQHALTILTDLDHPDADTVQARLDSLHPTSGAAGPRDVLALSD